MRTPHATIQSVVHWIRWRSAVDFLVLATALYWLLYWARQTRALRIALSIVGLHAAALVAQHFDLVITWWVLEGVSLGAIVLLVLLFQTELRHALLRLDNLLRLRLHPRATLKAGYQAIGKAAFALARERTGAIIVITRNDSVSDLVEGGMVLGAEISAELLGAIFQKTAPTHDGAVIIEADRIARAGAILPLTQRAAVPPEFGTRHRAAMGLAERCDALVLVVSEERGTATLIYDRRTEPVENTGQLISLLEDLRTGRPRAIGQRFHRMLFGNLRYKLAALGIAALIWTVTIATSGTQLRTVSVPIEFANVPFGMHIARQSATELQVQVRGNPWVMDSIGLSGMAATFDLSRAQEGFQTLRTEQGIITPLPGVRVEHVSPESVTIRITRR